MGSYIRLIDVFFKNIHHYLYGGSQSRVVYVVLMVGHFAALSGCGRSQEEVAAEAAKQRVVELAQGKALEEANAVLRQKEAEAERRRAEADLIDRFKGRIVSTFIHPDGVEFMNTRLSSSASVLCGQVNFKNGSGIYTTKEFAVTEDRVLLDSDSYQQHKSFMDSVEFKKCLDVPQINVATSSDDEYEHLNANIEMGDDLYFRDDKRSAGKIVDIERSHEFPDGTVRSAILLDSGVWIPREAAKNAFVKK